jgi:predicted ATPase/DNA-binding SARP family transcriptional activator
MEGYQAPPAKEIPRVNAHDRAAEPASCQVLAVLSPLIGREQDIATLTRSLPQQRLVTLWGPGGSGKTRLATQVAQRLQDAFADGCRFVDCSDVHEPDLLIQHISITLGLHHVDERAPLDTLIEWLRTRQLLLALDNGEHLLDVCANLVDALLTACPHLHVLVTSRELLNLPGELAYQVRPLTLPPPGCVASRAPGSARSEELVDLEAVGAFPAIQLFVQRAQMAQPDFTLTRENVSLVVTICHLLDGLPLAIELAAARIRMLALEQLAERLAQGNAVLGAGNRLAPARQQTLEATMTWSYQLLTPPEQQLFRRLALASSSFDLSFVETVGEGIEAAPAAAIDLLGRLIDKSLVTVVTLDGAARYRLLDTIRRFGREQVRQSGETEATYRLYSNWVRRLTEQAESALQGPDQAAWLARLDAEIEHVRTVIRWLLEQQEATVVIAIGAALVAFCEQRAHAGEAIRWLRAALASAEVIEAESEARALHALGVLSIRRYRGEQAQDYLTQAQDYLTRARDRYTQLDDSAGVASAWHHLGAIAFWRADYQAARICLEMGLKIVPAEAVILQAGLFHRLGTALLYLCERQEAIFLLGKSLTLSRQTGDIRGLALTQANLGSALSAEGDYVQAQQVLRESLRHYEDLGDRNGYLLALANLAEVALALEEPGLIQDYLAVALSSTWVECEIWLLAELFGCLARLALIQRQPLQAARLFGWTATLRHERSDQPPDSVLAQLPEASQDVTRGEVDNRFWLARYTAGWREGQLMELDDAFAYALKSARPDVNEQERERPQRVRDDGEKMDDVVVATTSGATLRAAAPPTTASMRFNAFGGGIVYRDDDQTSLTWRYSKARELLYFLVDAPLRTRGQIYLALWPDSTEEQANTHMRVTLYHLRKTLGDAAWALRTNGGYEFNRSLPYFYDVERFESLITQAQAVRKTLDDPDAAMVDEIIIGLLAEACALYRGEYLADLPPQEWIVQRQMELRRRYIDAQCQLGKAYQRLGNVQQALACYQQVTACDPFNEEAHAAIIHCYVQLRQRSQAIRHYRDLRVYLRDELGVTPDPHITSFVKTLLTQAEARG